MSDSTAIIPWTYDPLLVSVNKRETRTAAPWGSLVKGVGVDGRAVGSIDLFPGFRRLQSADSSDVGLNDGRLTYDLESGDPVEFTSVTNFDWFSIEKIVNEGTADSPDYQAYTVTGFWVRGQLTSSVGSGPSTEISLVVYYDGKTGAWSETVLENADGVTTGDASISQYARYLYYARDGITPKVFYWDRDDAAFTVSNMGPGTPIPREPPAFMRWDEEGGVLTDGSYQFAYRYANKDRAQYSALSEVIEVEIPNDGNRGRDRSALIELVFEMEAQSIARTGTSSASLEAEAWFRAVPTGGDTPGAVTSSFAKSLGVGLIRDGSNAINPPPRGDGARVMIAGPIDTEFNTIQIYRSISVNVGGGVFAGGVLYLEHEFDMPTTSDLPQEADYDSGNPDFDDDLLLTGIPEDFQQYDRGDGFWWRWIGDDGHDPGHSSAPEDEVLVSVPDAAYDPILDAAGAPPQSGIISVFERTTFMVDRGTAEGETVADIRWSSLDRRSLENFPDLEGNRYTPTTPADRVLRFVDADHILIGAAKTRLFRIGRIRDAISIRPVLHGLGVTNDRGILSIGGMLVIASPNGIWVVIGQSMDAQLVSALNRRIRDEWKASKGSIELSYDSSLGAVFILNTTTEEASVIWFETNAVTELEDMNFVQSTSGSLPGSTDPGERAFFITDGGLVVYPDQAEENTKRTMLGVTGTVTGNLTDVGAEGGGSITVTDANAAFDTDLQDCIAHLWDGDGVEYTSPISANTSTTFTVSTTSLGATPAVGWKYEISPIPFDVIWWMVGTPRDPRSPQDKLRLRTVRAMQVHFGDLSGGGEDNATARVGLVENLDTDFVPNDRDIIGNRTIGLLSTSRNDPVEMRVSSSYLFPRVRVVRSDLDFKLLYLAVFAKIEGSRRETI